MSVPHIDPAQAIQKMDAGEALVVDVLRAQGGNALPERRAGAAG